MIAACSHIRIAPEWCGIIERRNSSSPMNACARIAQKLAGFGQDGKHQCGAFVIAHLAFAEQHDQRSSLAVAHGVQL